MDKLTDSMAEKLWEKIRDGRSVEADLAQLLTLSPGRREEALIAYVRVMYQAGAQAGFSVARRMYADDGEEG